MISFVVYIQSSLGCKLLVAGTAGVFGCSALGSLYLGSLPAEIGVSLGLEIDPGFVGEAILACYFTVFRNNHLFFKSGLAVRLTAP